MLSDFDSVKNNIEILSELSGIRIKTADNNNISCVNPGCGIVYNLKPSGEKTGYVFLCPCGMLYFCSVYNDFTSIIEPVMLDNLLKHTTQASVFIRLKMYYLLKALTGDKRDTVFFTSYKILKNAILSSDKILFDSEMKNYLVHLIESYGDDIHLLKSGMTEMILDIMQLILSSACEESKRKKFIHSIKKFWTTDSVLDSIAGLYDTVISFGNIIFTEPGEKVYHAKSEITERVISYIDCNYNKTITLDDLAKKVFVSSTYLSRIFKEVTGENILQYLNRIRIESSKYYLLHTNMSISAIAAKVGFVSAGYYSKIFKRIEHITPSEYRSTQESNTVLF